MSGQGMVGHEHHMQQAASFSRPFTALSGKRRGRCKERLWHNVRAVSKSDVDELEMHIAIASQKMSTAAKEDRFKEAAQLRDRIEDLRLKHRLLQVKHAEGMRASICHPLGQVIQHRKYNYLGVVFGVHSSCQAAEAWKKTMRIDRLPLGANQPFYQVLVDNRYRSGGAVTYVAQENIAVPEQELEGEDPIQHELVKQFFEGFDKDLKKYRPTESIVLQYPDSLEAQRRDNDEER